MDREIEIAHREMREPARISRIIEKVEKIWRAHPDLRLGQLITWFSGRSPKYIGGKYGAISIAPDLWDIEDTEWEELLDKELEKHDDNKC